MNHLLKWDKLLSDKRVRESSATTGHRNAFELDYDRIVGSSSVRRLQDKAQVFPLQENDFTRTRLTHSLEVSSLAMSIGKAVGRRIECIDDTFNNSKTEELTALLHTLGLIHDLGNPPFGHYGETVIRQWFTNWFSSNNYQNEKRGSNLTKKVIITENQKKDFLFFDGNVQNLRIVAKLQMLNDPFGVNFTYVTLASLMKYPWSSEKMGVSKKKKFGYFQSEDSLVKDIWKITGLGDGIRHPATFLLEAADDITYICDDIEDGVKKGLINWDDEFKLIKEKFKDELYKSIFDKLKKIDERRSPNIPDKMAANVLNFRNFAQGLMINHAVDRFIENYDKIMNGEFGVNELLSSEKIYPFVNHLKLITKNNCFNCKEVLSLELVGDKVIKSLLDIFIPTIIEANDVDDISVYAGKLYHSISSNFKYIVNYDYEKNIERKFTDLSIYEKTQLIIDYISGMTDSYAVNLYKELAGFRLP